MRGVTEKGYTTTHSSLKRDYRIKNDRCCYLGIDYR